jgi:hypothetical protein
MRAAGRLLLAGFALLLAIPSGAAVLGAGTLLDPALRDLAGTLGLYGIESVLSDLANGYPPDAGMVDAVLGVGRALLLLLVVPPALNAVVGEVLGWRALAWYAGATGGLTALLPWLMRGSPRPGPAGLVEGRITALLFAAGAVAGLVYWLFAGRWAGRPPAAMELPARARD